MRFHYSILQLTAESAIWLASEVVCRDDAIAAHCFMYVAAMTAGCVFDLSIGLILCVGADPRRVYLRVTGLALSSVFHATNSRLFTIGTVRRASLDTDSIHGYCRKTKYPLD